jgi:CHASE3 domain sensor protein
MMDKINQREITDLFLILIILLILSNSFFASVINSTKKSRFVILAFSSRGLLIGC